MDKAQSYLERAEKLKKYLKSMEESVDGGGGSSAAQKKR